MMRRHQPVARTGLLAQPVREIPVRALIMVPGQDLRRQLSEAVRKAGGIVFKTNPRALTAAMRRFKPNTLVMTTRRYSPLCNDSFADIIARVKKQAPGVRILCLVSSEEALAKDAYAEDPRNRGAWDAMTERQAVADTRAFGLRLKENIGTE